MKTSMKKIILCISIIFQFCMASYAQETDKSKQELQFVISNDQEILNYEWDKYPEISKPTHIAVIKFKNPVLIPESQLNFILGYDLHASRNRPIAPTEMISIHVAQETDVSKKPLKFVIYTPQPIGRKQYWHELILLANSENEVREKTKAFIDICNKAASDKLNKINNDIVETKDTIARIEKNIPEFKEELKELDKTMQEKIKEYAKVNYSDEHEDIIYDLTEKHLEELANLLRNVNFELAGLNAKIESINKYKKSELVIDNETLVKLNQILISTDIERAGAIAKKQAYETAFNQANDLHNLIDRRRRVSTNLNRSPGQLSSAIGKLESLEKSLENPSPEIQPAEIVDNTVIIRLVKQD